jgi:hypothetical protein
LDKAFCPKTDPEKRTKKDIIIICFILFIY